MKIKKRDINPVESNKEDYNFDFSIYEREEKKEDVLESIKKFKKPKITTLRSKFSPGQNELENITSIKSNIGQAAIKVVGFTNDIKDCWEMYACLNEYWARIKHIFGSVIQDEIKKIDNSVLDMLLKYQKQDRINYDLHRSLKDYRDIIYELASRVNLSFELEKAYRGKGNKAKSGIIE